MLGFCWITDGIFLLHSLGNRQLLGDPENPKAGDGFQGMVSQISFLELKKEHTRLKSYLERRSGQAEDLTCGRKH